jgi:hypothetical protein
LHFLAEADRVLMPRGRIVGRFHSGFWRPFLGVSGSRVYTRGNFTDRFSRPSARETGNHATFLLFDYRLARPSRGQSLDLNHT